MNFVAPGHLPFLEKTDVIVRPPTCVLHPFSENNVFSGQKDMSYRVFKNNLPKLPGERRRNFLISIYNENPRVLGFFYREISCRFDVSGFLMGIYLRTVGFGYLYGFIC